MMHICFTVGSWIFISILLLAYFLNNKDKDIRTKLYKCLLISAVALLIAEIVSTFTFLYADNYLAKYITLKINWSVPIFWFYFLGLYCVSIISNVEADSFEAYFKENKKVRTISYLTLVVLIIYFLLPFNGLQEISYLPGICSYFVLAYCGVVVFVVIVRSLTSNMKLSSNVRFAFATFVFTITIILTLQVKFPTIALETLGVSIQMLLLYFSVENPDIKSASQLKELQTDINKSNKTKSDFLASMSNNIASPVNDIITYSKDIMNRETYSEEETKANIDKIVRSGNELLSTINNIMDITILESSNNETLNETTYSSINLLKDLINVVNSNIQYKHIQFILDVDSRLPSKLKGDYSKLYHSLLNLLSNSVRFTNVGKIKFSAYSTSMDDTCTLVFKISDTGDGMKEELVQSIKAAFSKKEVNADFDAEALETGSKEFSYGLALVKKYTDLMGATVDIESEYGAGTTFKITVKQEIVDPTPVGDTEYLTQEKKINDYLDCSQYKALIVDDDTLSLKILTRILSLYHFQIETLNSGKECIYNVKLGKKYDIIFIDHMMHDIDGIDTMQKLHKLEDYKIPPIIVITANVISGMREKYIDDGFDDYLEKPINKEELDSIIQKIFNK